MLLHHSLEHLDLLMVLHHLLEQPRELPREQSKELAQQDLVMTSEFWAVDSSMRQQKSCQLKRLLLMKEEIDP